MRIKRTINVKGVNFDVSFDFSPPEKETRDNDYQPERIEYIHIEHNGESFDEFFEDDISMIEDLIWKTFES